MMGAPRLLAVLAALALLVVIPLGAAASPGDPDRGFSRNGRVLIDVSHDFNQGATDLATDPRDGDIVVLAQSRTGIAVIRLDPDGKLDRTFGGGDGITEYARSEDEGIQGVTIDVGKDGRIVAGGRIIDRSTSDATIHGFLMRLDADGEPDQSLDEDGVLIAASDSEYRDIQQVGSKIVVVGSCGDCAEATAGFAWRLLDDGSPDPTFSGDGAATLVRDMPFGFERVGVDGRGRITTVGWSDIPSGATRSLTARFGRDGEPDQSFCGHGVAWKDLGIGSPWPLDLRVSKDGSSISVWSGTSRELAVVRRGPTCTLDPHFGAGGVSRPKFPNYRHSISVWAARILPRGRVLLAGDGNTAFGGLRVARLTTQGRWDQTFGRRGIAKLHVDASFVAVTADARGRPIAGGWANTGTLVAPVLVARFRA